jgi:ABC-2 type transport system ATP-binding protein
MLRSLVLGVLQALLMIGGPLVIAALLVRRWRLSWGLFGAGAVGFLGSQLVHLPIVFLIKLPEGMFAKAAILGLLAGACEEPARYLVLSRWLKRAEKYEEGLLAGLGHGGIEAIALGIVVIATMVGAMSVPTDAPASVREAAASALNAPLWTRLLSVGERACAMTFHCAMSLLVLRAARRKSLWLLLAAIGAHALLDASAVAALAKLGVAGAEGVALAGALIGLFAILHVRGVERRERAVSTIDRVAEPLRDRAISTRALTKDFDGRVAVDAVSLDVDAGKVIALLGPNGAGKTTTVRMLCALIAPTRGTASVCGQELVRDAEALRPHVGILTETPGLYERLTAWENLDLFARLYGMAKPDRDARIEKHLRALDLWERRDERVAGFSKGMKQKLAIVRALIHEPDVVFLDEPTSGLDPVAAREVHEMVRSLKAQGRTILLTTHRLAEAEALADLVAIVQSKLLVLDSFDHLKQKMFGKKVRIQFAGGEEQIVPVNDPESEIPTLVRELVAQGKSIVSVGEQSHSLEEIYLGLVKS